jgi:hypothetical protein
MMSAVDVRNIPCPTKELTIKQVAVLDCNRLLTPKPDTKAKAGLFMLLANKSRREPPKTRKMPVRTVCVPHTKSAMAASKFNKLYILSNPRD